MGVVFSKITSKSQTVIPREIREKLGVGPGDRLAYSMSGSSVTIQKAEPDFEENPFVIFNEWASTEDEKAYADL